MFVDGYDCNDIDCRIAMEEALADMAKEGGQMGQMKFDENGVITEEGMGGSVNHPSHYNREDSMECIDEMVVLFGKKVVQDFCLCNVWKYRYRASEKNGQEDLKKSDWYMKKYIELGGKVVKL